MPPTWAPTAADVKAIIPHRTGGEAFSTTTVPTLVDVDTLIEDQAAQLVAEVGHFDPAVVINPDAALADEISLGDLAKAAASLGVALGIEDSYYPNPEMSPDGHQPGRVLYLRYRRAVAALESAIARAGATGVPSTSLRVGTLRTPSARLGT